MLIDVREFLNSGKGKGIAAALVVIVVAFLGYSLLARLGPDEVTAIANKPMAICSQTGRTFRVTLERGMTFPAESPYSGSKTGYPAEACYWNADGSIRKEPYYVLLNGYVGKPGPTFCPDCQRLVYPQSVAPQPGDKPPPTKAEATGR
jgi:hypothetical protein